MVDSLALAHRDALSDLVRLTRGPVDVVHVVGGGSRNRLFCQSTADATGLPFLAGPVEATALGHVLVQARALGVDLAAMRALVRATQPLTRFAPGPTG